MAMFLIAGSFRITGAQPDGDSIRFTPDDPAKWDLITGPNKPPPRCAPNQLSRRRIQRNRRRLPCADRRLQRCERHFRRAIVRE
jgi:hypothetical protein